MSLFFKERKEKHLTIAFVALTNINPPCRFIFSLQLLEKQVTTSEKSKLTSLLTFKCCHQTKFLYEGFPLSLLSILVIPTVCDFGKFGKEGNVKFMFPFIA